MTLAQVDAFRDMMRIDAACFTDGIEDEYVIEFWSLSGSIIRSVYNKRTTQTESSFIPVNCWEFDKLQRMADAQRDGAFYSI